MELPREFTGCPTCGSNKSKGAKFPDGEGGLSLSCHQCKKCKTTYVRVLPRSASIAAFIASIVLFSLAGYCFYEYWFVDSRNWALNFTYNIIGQILLSVVGVAAMVAASSIYKSGGKLVKTLNVPKASTKTKPDFTDIAG